MDCIFTYEYIYITRVSCQKGPTCHADAWQIGPFWEEDILDNCSDGNDYYLLCLFHSSAADYYTWSAPVCLAIILIFVSWA